VSSTAIANACTASAAVFMIKDCRFTGGIDDVKCLRNNIIKCYNVENGSFKYHLVSRILKLDVTFQSDRQAIIKVVLKETNEYHKYSLIS
jgi:hypothetical protein